jgi:hypothetical protein
MLSSAIVVFSVSSVSDFQRREDDAVAVFVHSPGAVTPLWGHDPADRSAEPLFIGSNPIVASTSRARIGPSGPPSQHGALWATAALDEDRAEDSPRDRRQLPAMIGMGQDARPFMWTNHYPFVLVAHSESGWLPATLRSWGG